MTTSDIGPAPDDWIEAGLRQLAKSGIDSVRVERLAKILGISKGPFYWRFSGRDELLAGMLEYWRRAFTLRAIEKVSSLPARTRVETLFEELFSAKAGKLNFMQTESSVRAWASQDPMAAKVVRQVDNQRLEALTKDFTEVGAPPGRAAQLARSVYLAGLGLISAHRYTPQLADPGIFMEVLRLALDEAERRG